MKLDRLQDPASPLVSNLLRLLEAGVITEPEVREALELDEDPPA